MTSIALIRRARAIPSNRRTVGFLTAIVLGANAVVLGAGWVDPAQHDVAGAAVALAATAEAGVTDLDPLAGLVVQIPIPSITDPDVVLPVPEPAPRNAHAATPVVQHGLLEIPAIGLSQTMFEGVTLTAINRGPSHWPGTAMPGEFGNVVVAGHRTTYSRPFYRLNELTPGDELIFTVDGEHTTYVLDRVQIVSPSDVHIIDQTTDRTATLFACHPRGSARQRIVAHFRIRPATVSATVPDVGATARSLLAS